MTELEETARCIISGQISSESGTLIKILMLPSVKVELIDYTKEVIKVLESGSTVEAALFQALRLAVRTPSCANLFSKKKVILSRLL